MKTYVRAIVVHDNKLLLMRRNKYGKHYYSFVGGKVEPGEDLASAVKREVLEETSMTVETVREVYVGSYKNGNTTHFFVCKYVSGEPQLQKSSEEAQDNELGVNTYLPLWVPLDKLHELVLPVYPDSPEIINHLVRNISQNFSGAEVKIVDFIK
jgi:8-oxo-dGTP diphosphatase